jgi:hypothetical protein
MKLDQLQAIISRLRNRIIATQLRLEITRLRIAQTTLRLRRGNVKWL